MLVADRKIDDLRNKTTSREMENSSQVKMIVYS